MTILDFNRFTEGIGRYYRVYCPPRCTEEINSKVFGTKTYFY